MPKPTKNSKTAVDLGPSIRDKDVNVGFLNIHSSSAGLGIATVVIILAFALCAVLCFHRVRRQWSRGILRTLAGARLPTEALTSPPLSRAPRQAPPQIATIETMEIDEEDKSAPATWLASGRKWGHRLAALATLAEAGEGLRRSGRGSLLRRALPSNSEGIPP